MGIERGVVRWYAQRQLLLEELSSLDSVDAQSADKTVSQEELQQQEMKRAEIQSRLQRLGPCPTPMMG